MKTLIATFLAVCLATSVFAGALAQESETSYAGGVGAPVTWSDDRGEILATMQVTSVNPDWMDYADNDGPDRGFVYQVVTVSVTNVSDAEIELRSNDFAMVDGYGRWLDPVNVSVADGVDIEIFRGSVPLAAGETTEQVLPFETPTDVPAGLIAWEPGSNKQAIVNLADAAVENGAIAEGIAVPSTWTDDRGNVIATFEVSEVNPDWLDYAENYAPDRGSIYQAVHFLITNESDEAIEVNPNSFSIMDSSGASLRPQRPNVADDAKDEVFADGVELAPGDSVNGMLVFLNFSGLEPTAVFWQPENGLVNVVVVGGSAAGPGAEATPVG